ncbi:MAG: CPBP family intramembrane metalloprotease [Planctomycetes bacterium]|nr:CPBP family intramembrane metalloprotease [Planctomycetota bacterium]
MQVEPEQLEIGFTSVAIGLAMSLVAFNIALYFHRRLPFFQGNAFRPGMVVFAAVFLGMMALRPIVYTFLDLEVSDDEAFAVQLCRVAWFQGSVCGAALMVIAIGWRLKGLQEIGFRVHRIGTILVFGFFAYLAYSPIYAFCCFLNQVFDTYVPQQLVQEMIDNPELLQALPVVLSACLFVPIQEELLFRGFLQSGLRDLLGPWPSILLSSVFFGSMHEIQAIFPVIALGCILGWLRERTGSIFPSILVHIVHNTLMLFVLI